jgi:hypothetical protein
MAVTGPGVIARTILAAQQMDGGLMQLSVEKLSPTIGLHSTPRRRSVCKSDPNGAARVSPGVRQLSKCIKHVSLSQTCTSVSLADRGLLVFQYHCAIRSDVVAVCRLWWWHFHVLRARCSPVTLFWPPRRLGAGSLHLRRGREEPHIHNLQQGSSVEFHDL